MKREKRLKSGKIEDAELFGGGYAKCPNCSSLKLKQNSKVGYWYCYSCDTEFERAIFIKQKEKVE